jgi:hypothetical protein
MKASHQSKNQNVNRFEIDESVKGGAKLDHRGGEKVDHFLGSWGFGMRDLRGRLERRPAAPAGRRV